MSLGLILLSPVIKNGLGKIDGRRFNVIDADYHHFLSKFSFENGRPNIYIISYC